MKGSSKVKITAKNLDKYAGVRRFRYGEAELEDLVGITTGLAWTEVGGELLQVEAVLVPGRGKVTVTGKLGDVMQESVQAANAYVRSAPRRSASSRTSSRSATSTCTCRKARRPRMVRRPAWR